MNAHRAFLAHLLSFVLVTPLAARGAQAAEPSAGTFPKSIRVPGTDVSFSVGGYVKADFILDMDPIEDRYEFKTNSIPVEGTADAERSGQTTLHARESRINLDVRSETPRGPFRAFVEGDFFGDGNSFRLRHAYGELGPVLAGQTWTTFMDISTRPWTIDYEGPDAEIYVRQTMFRWTHGLSEEWTLAVAVENPSAQFAVPGALDGEARSTLPDLPAHVRYVTGKGHLQISGMLRQLRFDGIGTTPDASTLGWGLAGALAWTTFDKDEVVGQLAFGEGIGRYVESFIGQDADAVFQADGDLSSLGVVAFVVGYRHHWSESLRSGVAFSMADLDDDPDLPGGAIGQTQDFRANLIWTPYALVDFGGEVLWGRRENQNEASGDALRFQFAATYRLN
jgi:hypothetical protein